MANDIDKTSPHYKGEFGSIYEVNQKFPSGGVEGDYVAIDGWAHYWNADRGTWCVNAQRDSYWDELITGIINKLKLFKGATYMGVADVSTVPEKIAGVKMYYFAKDAGTYSGFGGLQLAQGINVLYTDNGTSWSATPLLEVAQELGVSTEKVMSQKAVNTELGKKADKEAVDASLDLKANESDVVKTNAAQDAEISRKANQQDVERSLNILRKEIGERTVVEGNVNNNPDEEDLTSKMGSNNREVLSLKDREYNPLEFSGKGYKILRKNLQEVTCAITKIQVTKAPTTDGYVSIIINGVETHVDLVASTDNTVALVAKKIADKLSETMDEYVTSIDGALVTCTRRFGGDVTSSSFSGVNTGSEATVGESSKTELRNLITAVMLSEANTIYEIRYDFDLNGEIITIPENCVFKFCGGSFKNGILNGKNSIIEAYPIKIFDDINIIGTFLSSNEKYYCEWFGGDIEKCIYSFKQINFVGTYNINNQIYIEGDNISPKIIFEKTSKIHVSDTFNDDYLFKFKISGYNEGNIIDQSCLFEGNGYINLNKRCGFCTFEKYNDKSIEVKFLNLVINGAGIGDNDPDNTQICIIKTLESTIMMNVSCYTDRQKKQPYAGIYLGGADNKLHRVTVIINTIGIANIGGTSIIEDAHIWGAPKIAFEVVGNATFSKCYGDWAVINYYFKYNNPYIAITDHFYIGMNADQNDDYSNIYKSTTFIKVNGGTGATGHANMICQNSTTRVIPYSCNEGYFGGDYANPNQLDIKVIGGKTFSQLNVSQKNSIFIENGENKIILSGILDTYVKYVYSIYIYNINKVIDLELTKSGYRYNDSSVNLSDYIELYRFNVEQNIIFYVKAIKSNLYIKLDPTINLTIFKYNYISLPKDGAVKCNIVNAKSKEDKISINLGEQDNGTHFYKICKLNTIYNVRFLDAVFTLSSSLSTRITIDFSTLSIYFQNVFRNTDNDLTNYLDFYISKDKSVLYVKTSVRKSLYANLLFYLRTLLSNMTFYNTLADDVNIDDLTLMNKYDSYTKGKDVTGSYYFNKSNNALMIYTNKWKKVKTIDENLQESGSTLNRPVNIQAGFLYFDTNLNKPIWWTGERWVDATGADV